MTELTPDNTNEILVDGHVHFHRGCDAIGFLSTACTNLLRLASDRVKETCSCFVLAMVDGAGDDGFDRLNEAVLNSENRPPDDREQWVLSTTDETISACFMTNESSVVVVRGQQLRTKENLEVLALGVLEKLDEGLPIEEVIGAVAAEGGVPVIPWGFGKWSGRRRRVLHRLLETAEPSDFFLGDNANRPAALPRAQVFRNAEDRGFRILPGSDPLPLPGECSTVGRAGFTLPGPLDQQKPAEDLLRLLRESSTRIQPFVELEEPFRFFRNQLKMQRLKLKR